MENISFAVWASDWGSCLPAFFRRSRLLLVLVLYVIVLFPCAFPISCFVFFSHLALFSFRSFSPRFLLYLVPFLTSVSHLRFSPFLTFLISNFRLRFPPFSFLTSVSLTKLAFSLNPLPPSSDFLA